MFLLFREGLSQKLTVQISPGNSTQPLRGWDRLCSSRPSTLAPSPSTDSRPPDDPVPPSVYLGSRRSCLPSNRTVKGLPVRVPCPRQFVAPSVKTFITASVTEVEPSFAAFSASSVACVLIPSGISTSVVRLPPPAPLSGQSTSVSCFLAAAGMPPLGRGLHTPWPLPAPPGLRSIAPSVCLPLAGQLTMCPTPRTGVCPASSPPPPDGPLPGLPRTRTPRCTSSLLPQPPTPAGGFGGIPPPPPCLRNSYVSPPRSLTPSSSPRSSIGTGLPPCPSPLRTTCVG